MAAFTRPRAVCYNTELETVPVRLDLTFVGHGTSKGTVTTVWREPMRIMVVPSISPWRTAGVVVAAALLMVACGGNISTPPKTTGGGVVTFADLAGAAPNYIFPMMSSTYESPENLYDLVGPMYLELYAFGPRKSPVVSPSLSLADPPVFSDRNTEVTVSLKHWRWSDGKPVTARDVIFWMNLLSAVTDPNSPAIGSTSSPGPGWGGEVPGGFPANVVTYTQTGEYSVVFHLNASYNPTWYEYNELSQIYALPQQSWDELASSGPIGNYDTSAEARRAVPNTSPTQYEPTTPGTAIRGALGVAQFLNTQAQDPSTYDTNPLWKVVDGPFKLTEYTADDFVKFVPNKNYSGSPKPTISAFELEPFTSDSAEYLALRSGHLTIGYVPAQDVGQNAALEKQEDDRFSPWNIFATNYIPYNFSNTTSGPIFSQLYFRQAFQSMVDQPQYIKDFSAGIGSVGSGPVPQYPAGNPFESPLEKKGQVYPYDTAKAVKLLKDNGWTVKPGGTSYCSHPGTGSGECGAGIAVGQKASFSLLYASGITALTNEVEAMQSTMHATAGVVLTLKEEPSAQVIATEFAGGCSPTHHCNNWDLAMWNFSYGWVFGPDFLPTGEELYETGASANGGGYSSPTDDANILATTTASNQSAETTSLFKYEDYLAKTLPVVWMPTEYYQLTMYKSDLRGLLPQSVMGAIYPQYYSFKSK